MDGKIINNININTIELLAPVSAAILLNTLRVEELIALQKGESFDIKKSRESLLPTWAELTVSLQKMAKESSYPSQ